MADGGNAGLRRRRREAIMSCGSAEKDGNPSAGTASGGVARHQVEHVRAAGGFSLKQSAERSSSSSLRLHYF